MTGLHELLQTRQCPPVHTVGIELNLGHLADDMVHITGFCYSVCLTHCTVSCPTCLNVWLLALLMASFLHAVHFLVVFYRHLRLLPSSRLPQLLSFIVPRSVKTFSHINVQAYFTVPSFSPYYIKSQCYKHQ